MKASFYTNANYWVDQLVTKAGVVLRDKENIGPFLSFLFMISATAVSILAISRTDGMNLRYNSYTGSWEPIFHFDLRN